MNKLKNLTTALITGEEGQAMVEYPLIIALVSVVAIGVLTTLGGNINTALGSAASKIKVTP
jgi:pilus assembly protein Flp/PilA